MNPKVKDVLIRAAKTAVQTGLAGLTAEVLIAAFGTGGDGVDLLFAAGLGALGAAWSVIHNAILAWTRT